MQFLALQLDPFRKTHLSKSKQLGKAAHLLPLAKEARLTHPISLVLKHRRHRQLVKKRPA